MYADTLCGSLLTGAYRSTTMCSLLLISAVQCVIVNPSLAESSMVNAVYHFTVQIGYIQCSQHLLGYVYHRIITQQTRLRTQALQCYSFPHLIHRWYYSRITGREAETLLLSKGQHGSFLVRPAVDCPGYYVLCTRSDKQVLHILICTQEQGVFHLEGGPTFESLKQLIEYYQQYPLTSKSMFLLNHPLHSTAFLPANILKQISELEKQSLGLYGKSGFWEEFEVCTQDVGTVSERTSGTSEKFVSLQTVFLLVWCLLRLAYIIYGEISKAPFSPPPPLCASTAIATVAVQAPLQQEGRGTARK